MRGMNMMYGVAFPETTSPWEIKPDKSPSTPQEQKLDIQALIDNRDIIELRRLAEECSRKYKTLQERVVKIEQHLELDTPEEIVVGSRVTVRFVNKVNREWSIVAKEGKVVECFPLIEGNQPMYRVEYEDGTFDNTWEHQIEVLDA